MTKPFIANEVRELANNFAGYSATHHAIGHGLLDVAYAYADRLEADEQAQAQSGEWPEELALRDTGLQDDQGGLGQRIFTTAGAGYKKVKYVRADLVQAPAAEVAQAQAQSGEWMMVPKNPTKAMMEVACEIGVTAEDWHEMLTAAQAQPPAARVECVWTEDEDGNWDTGCGNMFVLTEGTPYDNEMWFCCYCGGKLDQVTQADAAMAQESGR